MNALDLLTALRRLLPSATPSFTLSGDLLMVGLCHHDTKRFPTFTLDAADMQKAPDALAAEIVTIDAAWIAEHGAQETA